MKVDLKALQGNLIDSVNALATLLDKRPTSVDSIIIDDAYDLERLFNEMRNDAVMLCGLIDPTDNKSILDDPEIKIKELDYDKYEE